MDDTLKQRMRKHIKLSEGVESSPYKDTNGYLTVGVGFNVDSKDTFSALKLQVKDAKTGAMRDATKEEKEKEFDRLSKMATAKVNSDDDRKKFTLPDSEIDTKLDGEIESRITKIKGEIGDADWDKLTDGQKTAVLDVHYANGSLSSYTSLKDAIKAGDGEKMAKQSDFAGGKILGSTYKVRNFDRLRRNRAAFRGIDENSHEACRDIADSFRDHPKLPDVYKTHQTPENAAQAKGDGKDPKSPGQGPGQPKPSGEAATHDKGAFLTPEDAARAKAAGAEDSPWDKVAEVVHDIGDTAGTLASDIFGIHSAAAAEPNHPLGPPALPQTVDDAAAKAAEAPATPADPRVTQMQEMAATPVTNKGQSAMLKRTETLTQPEMMDLIHHAQGDYRGWRSGDPLKAHAYEKVQDWHVGIYGDDPQQTDGGKPIEPHPIRPIPEKPSPHTTPQGEDLWQATSRLGQKVADAAQTDGTTNAVKALQQGLNLVNQANPLGQRSPAYGPYTKLGPVEEDGKYGPQTDFAMKHATARLGPTRVEEGLALGRFNQFARNAQKSGSPEGLEDKTHNIFGSLFRAPTDTKAPKVEAGVLQEALNALKPDDQPPLKVDNWIGPKTTEAFGTVLKSEDADEVTRRYGRALGMLA